MAFNMKEVASLRTDQKKFEENFSKIDWSAHKEEKKEKCYCFGCGEYLGDDYEPMMCCSGYMCGCYGLPTNPPFCNDSCVEKYRLNKMEHEL